jgi:SPOR domain
LCSKGCITWRRSPEMRNFFLLLLLINLLAFAYQRWILEPEVAVAPDFIAQDVPLLLPVERKSAPSRLTPEAGSQPQPAVEASQPRLPVELATPLIKSPAAVLAEQAYQCIRVGPFAREPDLRAVEQELQRRQASVRRTTEAGRIWLGYWVQSAAYSSRQAAEIARKTLINKDMPDVYIIAEDNEFRVSLGVFRLRTSADDAVARASSQGLATRVVERYQPGTNYWLIARMPGGRDLPTTALPSVPGQILRTERIPCAG